jgi:hypothetical protein
VPRNYSDRDLKILFGLSGNRCAFPTCRNEIIARATDFDPAAVVGQVAHIVASSEKGPRGDPDFPKEQLDREPNLLLLCGQHHALVDKQPNTFTVEQLRRWKQKLGAGKSAPSEGPTDLPTTEAGDAPLTAFISWAHSHRSWDDERAAAWRDSVLAFAAALDSSGVRPEIDLYRLHDPETDWSRYGTTAIRESDYVLIAISAAYRERWEGSNRPTEGAGAAWEANALMGMFDRNQRKFRRKVKVVVLPGQAVDDIPDELRSGVQRFELSDLSAASLEPLIRTLANRPMYLRGRAEPVPPVYPEGSLDPTDAAELTSSASPDELVESLRDAVDRGKYPLAHRIAFELAAATAAEVGDPAETPLQHAPDDLKVFRVVDVEWRPDEDAVQPAVPHLLQTVTTRARKERPGRARLVGAHPQGAVGFVRASGGVQRVAPLDSLELRRFARDAEGVIAELRTIARRRP